MRLLIPRDLPWLFPIRTRWVVATEVLFTVAWVAGFLGSLSNPIEGVEYCDRGLLHGLVLGIVPAIVVSWTFKTSSTARMIVIMVASVLVGVVAARLFTRPTAFILLG